MAIFDKISGISTGSGFKYQAQKPLDARLVVDFYNELLELEAGNGAYEGMLVYVKNQTTVSADTYPKGYYIYKEGGWEEFNTSKVPVNLGSGQNTGDTKQYANITISSEEPANGNTGDIWFKY